MLAEFRLVSKGTDLGEKVQFSPCDTLNLTMNVSNDEASLAQLGKLIGVDWGTASNLDKLLLRSVTYKYLMIAVVVQSSESRQVVGYRLYDMRFDTVADFTIESIRDRISEGSVVVQNLEVDANGNLYCSHGKLDDYSTVDRTGALLTKAKCVPLGLPPLNNVIPCVDYKGTLTMITSGDVASQQTHKMVHNRGVAPKQSGIDTCTLGSDWVVKRNDEGKFCVTLGERFKRSTIADRVELFSPEVIRETSMWFNGAIKGSEEAERSAATLPIHYLASEGFLWSKWSSEQIASLLAYETYYSPLDALHLFRYDNVQINVDPHTDEASVNCTSLWRNNEWVVELRNSVDAYSAANYIRPIIKEFLNIRNLCHYNWHRMIEPHLGAARGTVVRVGSAEYGILDGMHIYAMLFNLLLLAPFCTGDCNAPDGVLNELMDNVNVFARHRQDSDWYNLIYQRTQEVYIPRLVAAQVSGWQGGQKQSSYVYFRSVMKLFNELRKVLLDLAEDEGIAEEELYLPVLPLCIVRYIREQELHYAMIRSNDSDKEARVTSEFDSVWYGNFWSAREYDTPLDLDAPLKFVSRIAKTQTDLLITESNDLRFSGSPTNKRVLDSVVINPKAVRSVVIGEFPMARKLVLGDNITEFWTEPLKRETAIRSAYLSSCWREFESGVSLTEIMGSLFEDCRALEKVVIKSAKSIGSKAFANCISLKQLTLPSNLKVIRNKSFAYCTSLHSLVLPEGIEVIEDEAFLLCTGLERIVFPASLREIGKRAFQSCDSLTSVQFNGVPKIHTTAFEGCMPSVIASLPKVRKGKRG